MDMNQTLRDTGRLKNLVSTCGDLSQPRAKSDHEIRRIDPIYKVCRDPQTQMSRVARMLVVDQVLTPKGSHHRQAVGLDEGSYASTGLVRPPRAAQDQ